MPQNARNIDAAAIPLSEIDVSNPQLYADDTWGQLFARLRREAPVHYCCKSAYGPYWSVTRYNDIMSVELDHATFSSASEHGGIQIADLPPGAQYGNFIRMDPPRHTTQRKTVAPIATPTHVAKLEDLIRERTAKVLDELPRNETFDWVDKVSIELTTMMLATLFDFPWEDRRLLPYWSDVAVANLDAPDSPVKTQEERVRELTRMAQYFAKLFEERMRKSPTFDLISMMVHSEAMRTQPQHEFIGNLALLIVGGNDTTRNTMTGGLLALHENPGEWAKLRANPNLVPSLVHETVRFQTPVIHMRRTATRDTELGGHAIRKGDKVVMWYVSGNRDESAIPEPDRFLIDRARPRAHMSYGAGIHRCVGERLADLQLRVLWEEILRRGMQIDVVGRPVRVYSNFLRGFRSMPVRFKV
jgi:cytochrome P450